MSKGLTKVELNVIALALHADPDQQSALRIQVEPELPRQIVAEVYRIQLKGCPSNEIMVPHPIPVTDRGDDVERAGHRNVERLVPVRVESRRLHLRLQEPLLVLVAEDNIRITVSVGVARLQVLAFNDFNREDVLVRPLGLMLWLYPPEKLGTFRDVHFVLELIESLHSKFNVVQFDKGLTSSQLPPFQEARRSLRSEHTSG